MNVVKMAGAGPGEPAVRLVDGDGELVAEVDGFLRLLAVREYSPDTIRAYAHDLQKLFAFLASAKFVTTPQYAPRLRERLCLERQIADDAEKRGWQSEADRHQRIADRIRGLLAELGEPCDPPHAEP